MSEYLSQLCLQEGFEVKESTVVAHEKEFPLTHPYQIYSKLYRDEIVPVQKLHYMKQVNRILWPELELTTNYWQDEIFLAHCEGWKHVVLAGGAGCGKSMSCALLAIDFWLSNPTEHAVIVCSTTLDSLESRIWGYIARLIQDAKKVLPIPANITGHPPKVLIPGQKDKIHGMFAVAVREGADERTLSTMIGRHPKKGMMVILDECTDISPTIIKAVPNWEQGVESFQLFGLGNSKSKNDLHGALATPKDDWPSVSPEENTRWITAQNGICLYFNPYNSPAIHEKDPIKKIALSKFLITLEKIKHKEREYGRESEAFHRFVLSWWLATGVEETIITESFLRESRVNEKVEWSGIYPLSILSALDAAIGIQQKGCVLRMALLGQDMKTGNIVIDFRGTELLHYIEINPNLALYGPQEVQMAERVIEHLAKLHLTLFNFCIDATGVGRGLSALIQVMLKSKLSPLKIVSTRGFKAKETDDPDLFTVPPLEQWYAIRDFIQSGQIRGLDEKTILQLANRKVIRDTKTLKETLEDKVTYQARMSIKNPSLAHSPNEADAAALIIQLASRRFGFMKGQRYDVVSTTNRIDQKYAVFTMNRGQQPVENQREYPRPPVASFHTSIEDCAKRR